MSASQSDRNVLFGVLALQMELITREGLIAALQAWTLQKSRPLGELLVELGHMSAEDRAALEPMVDRHVTKHGGSAEQSLAALSSVSEVAAELHDVNDADVQQSLRHAVASESRQAGFKSSVLPFNGPSDSVASASNAEGDDLPPQLQPTISYGHAQEQQGLLRFQLLRPHAEGALGKVWIAQDRELNREVAFKEIKPKRAHDRNSRGRFVLEAEITGGLEHPGIVPVYGLGHFADGRPFYAMRFIRGRSLRTAIKQFHKANGGRQPSGDGDVTSRSIEQPANARRSPDFASIAFRNLVQRLIDVCNAIAYAHSRGVLHRDLKPGNIMLGKYGETLVVDWGLAKAKGQSFDPVAATSQASLDREPSLIPQSSADVALTQMGSAIGTPEFMSPEQAAGRLDLLGPASDVYGLGATFYELLTGQAPIGARPGGESEKLTTPELLRRAEQGEFPAPRAVLAAVPNPLEAVCLKAMSRDPAARYATAQALAEDLERWLAGDPVSAWPEPVIVRARRWVKRHPTLVVSTAATVLISLVSLAAIASVVGQSNRTLATKNIELEQSNQREQEASSLAQENARKAQENATKAEQNAAVAREQSQLALKSLQSVIFDIQRKLKNVPGAGDLQRSLLQTALARLQEVSDQFASRGAIDRNTMTALYDLGDVFLRIGSESRTGFQPVHSGKDGLETRPTDDGPLASARKVYQQAFDIAQKLAAADPSDARAQRDLFISYNKLGDLQLQSGRVTEALGSYQKGLEISQKLAAADPSDAQAQRDLSISYQRLGSVQLQSGQVTEARGSYQKFLENSQKLAAADPSDVQAQRDLSGSYSMLGDVQRRSGEVTEARGSYQKGLEINQKLAAADPSDARVQRDLSASYMLLGSVQLQSGQVTEARGSYQKGLEITQKLAAADPSDAQLQGVLAGLYDFLGTVQLQSGQVTEARGSYQKLLKISQKLAAADPSNALAQRALSISYCKLGDVQRQSGEVTEAREWYQKFLEISQKLAAADPSNARAQRELSVSYISLGDVQLQSGQVTQALESYQKTLEISQKLAAADPSDSQAQRDLFSSYSRLGNVQLESGQVTEALESSQKSLEISQKWAAADPSDAWAQRAVSISYEKLGDVSLQVGKATEALEQYQKGLEIYRTQAATDPADAWLQSALMVTLWRLGAGNQQVKAYERAIEYYEQGLDVLNRMDEAGRQPVSQSEWIVTYLSARKSQTGIVRLPPMQKEWVRIIQRQIQHCKHAPTAEGEWKALLEQPADLLPVLLEMRGTQFVQDGRTSDAAHAIAKLRELGTATADQLYNAACVYSLCATGIKAEKDELTAEQAAARQQHIADALATLREAIKAGWKDFANMQTDPDVAILRDLPEFKALIPAAKDE